MEADFARRLCAGKINSALDVLAANPGDQVNRRRRFVIGLWGIPVFCGAEEWLILWDEDEDGVRVQHIVLAP